MKPPFKFRPIPPNFGKDFPDGDYTVGRGADPRGRPAEPQNATPATTHTKPRRPKHAKKPLRPAAE